MLLCKVNFSAAKVLLFFDMCKHLRIFFCFLFAYIKLFLLYIGQAACLRHSPQCTFASCWIYTSIGVQGLPLYLFVYRLWCVNTPRLYKKHLYID